MGLALLAILGASLVRADTTAEDRQVIEKAMDLLVKGGDTPQKFLYLRRREVTEFDGDGKVKTRQSTTTRRETRDGIPVMRVVARNDTPLSAEEQKRDEETIQAQLAQLRSRPQPPPYKTEPRKPGDEAAFMREFVNALDYRRKAPETIEGRRAGVFTFEPKPGYRPSSLKFKVFEKMKGTLWIDQATGEVIRGEAEMFDDVNVGFGLLGKVGKGTTFTMVRREAAPAMWVPVVQRIRFQARVMLVKSFRQEIDLRWTEYQLRPESPQTASTLQ